MTAYDAGTSAVIGMLIDGLLHWRVDGRLPVMGILTGRLSSLKGWRMDFRQVAAFERLNE